MDILYISNPLQYYRKKFGLTQLELARETGLSVSIIRKYEIEPESISKESLQKLSEYFKISEVQLKPKPDIEVLLNQMMAQNSKKLVENPNDQFALGYHTAIEQLMEQYVPPKK